MPDLATELSHLELADAHIQQAHGNIDAVSKRIAADESNGLDLTESLTTLETLQGTLKAFEGHRALIVRTIDDIRSGRI